MSDLDAAYNYGPEKTAEIINLVKGRLELHRYSGARNAPHRAAIV